MRNRKVRDLGQSEEDSLEATSKSSDGSKSSTSSSACTFSLSGQTLGNGSSSPALQGIKEEEQQQQLEQDQERALLSSMERALGGADEQQQQQQEGAEPPKRCSKCNKKLGLTGGFPCRCGGVFCNVHRYSDRHECNFDYRELGANEIRRDNPLTVPSKLKKL